MTEKRQKHNLWTKKSLKLGSSGSYHNQCCDILPFEIKWKSLLNSSFKLCNHTLHKLDQNPRIYRKGSQLCFLIQFCLANDNCLLWMIQLKLWGTHFSSQYNHCCFPTGSLFCCKRNVDIIITNKICVIFFINILWKFIWSF